jgi:hypothetical protein
LRLASMTRKSDSGFSSAKKRIPIVESTLQIYDMLV